MLPEARNSSGSPVCAACSGVSTISDGPDEVNRKSPLGYWSASWPVPEAFTSTVAPVAVFVTRTLNTPVTRTKCSTPSASTANFAYSPFATTDSRICVPQADVVKSDAGRNSQPSPRAQAAYAGNRVAALATITTTIRRRMPISLLQGAPERAGGRGSVLADRPSLQGWVRRSKGRLVLR